MALYGVLSGNRAEREGSGGLLGGGGIGGVESGVRVSGVCGGMCSSAIGGRNIAGANVMGGALDGPDDESETDSTLVGSAGNVVVRNCSTWLSSSGFLVLSPSGSLLYLCLTALPFETCVMEVN